MNTPSHLNYLLSIMNERHEVYQRHMRNGEGLLSGILWWIYGQTLRRQKFLRQEIFKLEAEPVFTGITQGLDFRRYLELKPELLLKDMDDQVLGNKLLISERIFLSRYISILSDMISEKNDTGLIDALVDQLQYLSDCITVLELYLEHRIRYSLEDLQKIESITRQGFVSGTKTKKGA